MFVLRIRLQKVFNTKTVYGRRHFKTIHQLSCFLGHPVSSPDRINKGFIYFVVLCLVACSPGAITTTKTTTTTTEVF